VGIFENLEKALAFDSRDVEGTIQHLDLLKERFAEMMAAARKDYLSIIENYSYDKAADKALEHFRGQEEKQKYYRFFKELANLYEILSPDPFLREYLDDYDQLARLYRLLLSTETVPLDKELMRKTARLVQEHTLPGAIKDAVDIYEINNNTLEKLAEATATYTVQVFNLLKSITEAVAERAKQAPYLLSIGEMAERIAQAYQERQLNTQEVLKRLQELIDEFVAAEKERAEKMMAPEPYTVYWLLKRLRVKGAENIAQNMAQAFDRFPYWHASQNQERNIRLELYKNLKGAAVKEMKALVDQILNLLKGARR